MSDKQFDPTERLKSLVGKLIVSISRYSYPGSDEARTGIDPILLETDEQSLYLTTDDSKGNLLIYDFDSLPETTFKGRNKVMINLSEIMIEGDDKNPKYTINKVEKISRDFKSLPHLYQYCGVKLTIQNNNTIYIGTHIRAYVDTDDLCILTEDEIGTDLIFSKL